VLHILRSIKHFHSSSEDLPTPIYDQFVDRFGVRIYCSLGQLETWLSYAVQTDDNYQIGTVGTAIPGTEIKIINEQGGVCSPGHVGEVYAKSPTNAMYYYKDYVKSQYTFNGEWIRTGDCAYWNEQGNLVFAGRVDDVFKINDLTIIPTEIESKIMFDTTISQVAVTGIQNAIGVKEVHVFVVPSDNFNLETFNKFLDTQLFAHQRPRHIHIIDALPETITNKKDRKTLSKVLNNAITL
jgi:acyl-coenzyme A synthetase/AMP-(fatty) acid ligase